jgi:cation:H+ antiporter
MGKCQEKERCVSPFILVFIGVLLLYFGAEALVRGASRLAFTLGVSPLIIGLTVVSFSTSMPEAVSSLVAQLYEEIGDIAIGNVVGSNVANIGLVLGIVLLISPLQLNSAVKKREMPIMIGSTLLFMLVMVTGHIGRVVGVGFLLALVGYIIFQIQTEKNGEENGNEKQGIVGIFYDLFLIVLGGALLLYGGYWFIKGAVVIATDFGISHRVIALTMVALGTSLPELATGVIAALRKESDIAIGNIVGSNIFNIFFIIGGVATIKPISFSTRLLTVDAPVMLGFSLLLWLMMRNRDMIGRVQGGILFAGYLGYMVFLFV